MTIINVENPIFTFKREVNIQVECLTDELLPVTTGKLALLYHNVIIDIQEVKSGMVDFQFELPKYFKSRKEYSLKIIYTGSTQAQKHITPVILVTDKLFEGKVETEVIVDDYYSTREDTIHYTARLQSPQHHIYEGKAVIKINDKAIDTLKITENTVECNYKIPTFKLNSHVLYTKFVTNQGIFTASSILHLKHKFEILSTHYHEDKKITNQIRQQLKKPYSQENALSDKNKKLL